MARGRRMSIEPYRLMGAVEREGRNSDGETFPALGLHLVAADHDARRRVQGRAAGILEGFARSQHRLLADDAGTAHVLLAAHAVGDAPVTPAQLHRLGSVVLDADVIRPDKVAVDGRGLVFEIVRLDDDFDRTRGFRIHGLLRPLIACRATERSSRPGPPLPLWAGPPSSGGCERSRANEMLKPNQPLIHERRVK